MNGDLCIAILGAGQAQRFGGEKLDMLVAGRPLGRFALDSALQLDAPRPVIIVKEPVPDFARRAAEEGVAELILNPRAHEGLATSVALAARSAALAGSRALLLMLADMPLVSLATLGRLAASAAPGRPAAVRHPDGNAGIPACFTSDHFAALQELRGDRGAATLLREAEVSLIDVPAAELRDIDTQADYGELEALARAEQRKRGVPRPG